VNRKNWTNEKLFSRLLTNKSDGTHWDNIRELRSRASEDIFRRSCELIKSRDVKKRLIGSEILSQFFGVPPRPLIKPILKLFFEVLKREKNSAVISTIFYGIGHNSEYLKKKDIKFLCEFRDNKNIEVKQGLVFALGGIDDKAAIDTLIDFTTDKHSSIRDWATFGIGAQSDRDNSKIREALWGRINDKHNKTRQEAIFGLAKRTDSRVKEVLINELEIIDHHGSYILEAIELFGDRGFIKLLERKIISNAKTKSINPEWLIKSVVKLKGIVKNGPQ
jgi:hypothetical protein